MGNGNSSNIDRSNANDDRRCRDDHSREGNGLYNAGYIQGRHDAVEGSDDYGIKYVAYCLPDGNRGYTDGYNDYMSNGMREHQQKERERENE